MYDIIMKIVTKLKALPDLISAVVGRIGTAEGNITDLGTAVTGLAGDVTTLHGKVTVANVEPVFVEDVTSATNTFTCRKMGNVLTINGRVNLADSVAGLNGLIMTLPEGSRPAADTVQFFYAYASSYNSAPAEAAFAVRSDGTIKSNMGSSTFDASSYIIFKTTIIL